MPYFAAMHAFVRIQLCNEGVEQGWGEPGFIFVMYFVIYVSHRLTRDLTGAGEQENKFNFMRRKLLLSRGIGR